MVSKNSILEVILGLEECSRLGARFVARSGEAEFFPYSQVVERAKSAAATLQSKGIRKGERVAVVLPTGIGFFDAFLGVQLAGGIPVAVYPPFRLGKLDEYFKRTRQMLRKVEAACLITDRNIKKLMGPVNTGVPSLREQLDVADLHTEAVWHEVEAAPEEVAFLQFSSGSTGDPKAVTISHANLLHNLEMIESYFGSFTEEEAERGGVCWLPLYHDMGLVGCLFSGLYHPGTVTYLSPDTFISRPRLWLQTLSKYKGVVSPAPDFAYALCLSKVRDEDMEGVDLSDWKIALNGAEPINPRMMERFAERFSRWGFAPTAMTPVYGLAEAVLAVTFSDWSSLPRKTEFDRNVLASDGRAVAGKGRCLVSVGRPVPGLKLEIRDDAGRPVGESEVGKIVVQGPSVTKGYFKDPEKTRSVFLNGWLDTGDLGFLYQGELYICGRIKDVIIIRGKNFAPQEIEELLTDVPGLRRGCVVAVSAIVEQEGEQLFILAERAVGSNRCDDELEVEIRDRVLQGIALSPHHIELLEPGTLPRTSSGKMRRAAASQMLLAGTLTPPDRAVSAKLFQAFFRSFLNSSKLWIKRQFGW